MFRQMVIASVIGSMLIASTAPAWAAGVPVPAARSQQAEIPFADMGGIRDWRPDGDQALYIQAQNGQWYHATLMSRSPDLAFAQGVGFTSEPTGQFDRFSSVRIDGWNYPLTSLVASAAPGHAG